jgi:hypothetical protein
MNVTTRRFVSLVVALALVAAVAAITATPAFAAKPDGKGKTKTAFTVRATLTQDLLYLDWNGDFAATGAIKDGGHAFYIDIWTFPTGWLTLYGEKGDVVISITFDEFTVESGTLAYENLQASGTAHWKSNKRRPLLKTLTLNGTVLSWEP